MSKIIVSRSHKLNKRVERNDYPHYYREPHSTQERKMSCDEEHKPYIRGKRSYRNLPNAWNDIPKSQIKPKSWKKLTKSKHQSGIGSRGKKHSIYLKDDKNWTLWRFSTSTKVYSFEEYCKKHSIPYNVVEKKRVFFKWYPEKIWVPNGKMKHWYSPPRYNKEEILISPRRIIYSFQDGDWVETGKQKKHKCRETIGYTLTWWSDKDIGIEQILKQLN